MPWGTIAICVILAVCIFFAVRRVAKKGACGGDCSGCGGSCNCAHQQDNLDPKK